MRCFLFLIVFTSCRLTVLAEDWSQAAADACDVMIKNFWGASFEGAATQNYFNATGGQQSMKNEWWWQAHAMDVVVDEYLRSGNTKYLAMFEPWYEGIIGSNYEHFDDDVLHNNSIDDMEWICITLIRMYEACGDKRYLTHARTLYDNYIMTTWGPENESPWFGGVSWSSDTNIAKSKNACSNGPAGIIAALLIKHYSSERARYKSDLDRIYDWEREYLFEKQTGAVWDNIHKDGIRKGVTSYNQGTFVAMAMYEYLLTNDEKYLNDAINAIEYTRDHLGVGASKVLSMVTGRIKTGDSGLFHGIFFRYLSELLRTHILPEDKQKEYEEYLEINAREAQGCLVSEIGIYSFDWSNVKIDDEKNAPLTPHVSGATLMSALAMLPMPFVFL